LADYDETEVRAKLDKRLEEIETARQSVLRDVGSDQEARDSELADYDQHEGDQGTETFEQELDDTRLIRLQHEREAVEQALERLAEGKYGISVDSGKPIPPERLAVMPEAIRTVEEQQRWDAQHGGTATGPVL
jgi:RNA polymerase-binding transcription factor DksA